MSDKVKICWASDFWQIGNAYGYSVHNRMMREHVARVADLDHNAECAVTIVSADKYEPIEGKYNFLFTMFETNHLPASYVRNLPRADHIIVPCEHNRRLFRKYTDRPISVCPEGVEPGVFVYKKRKKPASARGERFRYLWIGAPNPRKGFVSVLEGWKVFMRDPECELYLKTTAPRGLPHDHHAAAALDAARHTPQRLENIIFDARKISLEELVGLYHSAHCFLMPSIGEGWGLTLCEALATGCPSIATRYGGHEMFFDRKVGYPVKHDLKPYFVEPYGLPTEVAIPNTYDLMNLMARVRQDYSTALMKAKRGSRRVRSVFTWENAARRMVEIVKEEFYQKREAA